MDTEAARQWAQSFENKSISELAAMELPQQLGHCDRQRWNRARDAAIKAVKSAGAGNADSAVVCGMRETSVSANEDAEDEAFFDEDAPHADPAELEAEAIRAAERKSHEEQVENLRTRLAAAIERNNEALPAPVSEAVEALALPSGDAAQLLEHQLATGAALIDHLAKYIARNDTSPEVCVKFMDRMSAMLGKNADVGKVVGRLRGNYSETVQTIRVVRVEGEGGGRGAQT